MKFIILYLFLMNIFGNIFVKISTNVKIIKHLGIIIKYHNAYNFNKNLIKMIFLNL